MSSGIVWHPKGGQVFVLKDVQEKTMRQRLQKEIKELTGVRAGWEFWIDEDKSSDITQAFRIHHPVLEETDGRKFLMLLLECLPNDTKQ